MRNDTNPPLLPKDESLPVGCWMGEPWPHLGQGPWSMGQSLLVVVVALAEKHLRNRTQTMRAGDTALFFQPLTHGEDVWNLAGFCYLKSLFLATGSLRVLNQPLKYLSSQIQTFLYLESLGPWAEHQVGCLLCPRRVLLWANPHKLTSQSSVEK